jgi:endoglucanase
MVKLNFFKTLIAQDFSRFALTGVVVLAIISMGFGQQTFVGMHGRLSVKGSHIVDKNGTPLALHGMSMYGWTNACGYAFYNDSCITHLARDWKCTVIRIPYQTNGSITMSMLNTVIQACVNNGIYAIVDWHSDGGSQTDSVAAETFFRTVATTWGNIPNIMYEPWNEPSGKTDTWAVIRVYMESVIAAIRAIDSSNIIICGNPSWDQYPDSASIHPITDYKNIAYSLHFYAYSHHLSTYGPHITTAMKNGCAVFITEYGTCNASGAGPTDTVDTRLWYKFLDSNTIGSANWGVECVDENGGAACFTNGASTTGPWPSSVLTEDGAFVSAYIQKSYQGVTAVLPNASNVHQRANVQKMNGILTAVESKSADVFTINGVRCHSGVPLPNGVYIIRGRENISAGVLMRN